MTSVRQLMRNAPHAMTAGPHAMTAGPHAMTAGPHNKTSAGHARTGLLRQLTSARHLLRYRCRCLLLAGPPPAPCPSKPHPRPTHLRYRPRLCDADVSKPIESPAMRKLLTLLTKAEQQAAVHDLGLLISDPSSAEQRVAVLAATPVQLLQAVLQDYKRARLKELCRALGFSDAGKEKSDLVTRLLGAADSDSPALPPQLSLGIADSLSPPIEGKVKGSIPKEVRSPPASTPSSPTATQAQPQAQPGTDAAAGGKLTREQLERHLWAAADILRGSIDSSDYKSFIFGLLFLKRLSDRFDEECTRLREAGLEAEDRDEHQFFVPLKARWAELQRVTTGLGEVLNTAAAALEEANASLEGVLGGIDYNDQNKLGDAKQRDTTLHKLIQHFAEINLRNSALSEPDMLGRAYEYLIEKFADDAGKKGGEFYTPTQVVRLLVELLAPKEGMRICDPTCGSGGMLVQSAHYIVEHGGHAKNFSLFGQEKNLGTWAICKMNMLLHGFPDARIEKGDTLRDPKLLQEGHLMLFDRVIANPPFSLDSWGHESAEADGHGRFRFGIPPKTKGDLAFVQHMVATLNQKGRAAIVMPHGVLFRGSSEGAIRQGLLQEDLVEAVIGLPSNLFYGTGIPAAVLLLSRDKPSQRKGKVLFVEASREYREGSAQNFLQPEQVQKIVATTHAFADVERYARVVPLSEIEKNDYNLNISRYVETAEAQEKVDLADAIRKLREAEHARDTAKGIMDQFLRELGYGDS